MIQGLHVTYDAVWQSDNITNCKVWLSITGKGKVTVRTASTTAIVACSLFKAETRAPGKSTNDHVITHGQVSR